MHRRLPTALLMIAVAITIGGCAAARPAGYYPYKLLFENASDATVVVCLDADGRRVQVGVVPSGMSADLGVPSEALLTSARHVRIAVRVIGSSGPAAFGRDLPNGNISPSYPSEEVLRAAWRYGRNGLVRLGLRP